MRMLNEYRCTCVDKYPMNSLKEERQGYYVNAKNEEDAKNIMKRYFPNETNFIVDLWKVDNHRV